MFGFLKLEIMKTLHKPANIVIALSYIPILLIFVYLFVTKIFPNWVLPLAGIFAILTISLTIYYCIKQKCLAQIYICIYPILSWALLLVVRNLLS